MYKEFIRELFVREGYMWSYPYDCRPHLYFPHALLTSGKHSDFFANVTAALHNPEVLYHMMNLFSISEIHDYRDIDFIMCPGYGAVALAAALSWRHKIPWGYTDKVLHYDEILNKIIFKHENKRFDINDKNVLVVEDVITTTGSVQDVLNAVVASGGEPLDEIFTVLNRSRFDAGEPIIDGGVFYIENLIRVEAKIWEPEECPLCKEGSKALKPKANWDQFMGGTGSNG